MIKQNGEIMIRSNSKTAMPDKILQQVHDVQRSSRFRDRLYAWLIAGGVLATLMIVAMIVESQLNLFSHTLRFVLTIASLVATVVCGWIFWQRGKRQNERLVSAAEQVDSTFPVLEQRVSTLTSCEEERLNSQLTAHPAMLNRLAVEASRIHENVKPQPVVSKKILKRPLCWLAAVGLVFLGLFMWDAPKTMVQLGRFWTPWANLSVTKISSVEKDSVVARHEPIKLTAALGGRPVEELQLVSRTVKHETPSQTKIWPSSKDPSVATFRQSKAVESFDYCFRAGDGQTAWHRVTVADRPKIENLKMRIVPPAYTGKAPKTFKKIPKKLRVLQGSQLEIAVKPKASVRTARLVMGKTNWLPMALDSSGAFEGSMELFQPVNFEVQLTELHGLVNRRPPRCRLQVVSDQAPRVRIVRPTKSTVLMPDETLDIHFKATDDHGIEEMALRVYTQRQGEDQPTVHEVAIPLDDEKNRRKIEGSVALDLQQFDLRDGDSIRYEVRARDNFVPPETELQAIESQPIKGVQLTQNSQTSGSPNQTPAQDNGTANTNPERTMSADSVVAEDADPNAQVAQASSTENSDPEVPGQSNSEAPAKTAQANVSTSPSQASPSQDSQAQAAQGNSANQNQVSANSSSNGSNQNSQAQKADSSDRGSTAEQDVKPPAQQMANNSNDPNAAVGENRIGAQQEPKNDSVKTPDPTPDPNSIAKSDNATKQGDSNQADPAANADNGTNNPANGSSQANSSQQRASQQASQSRGNPNSQPNSNNPSQSNSSGQEKMAANETEKPDANDPESADDEKSNPTKSDPVKMAMRRLDVGQSSSSGQQQIKVDQYAGGFTSEHRNNCLLYTSPSPRDQRGSRMPSSA